MARAFHLNADGSFSALLDADERELLIFLVEDVLDLLAAAEPPPAAADPFDALIAQFSEHPVHPPTDPALHRLFPDAFAGDEQASAEFRRFTEAQLRTARSARSQSLVASLRAAGEELVLSQDQAHECVQTLTDLRLVLGTRLGITDDHDRNEATPAHEVYDWLTWLQESLVQVLFMLPPRETK
ncbi:MAG: DUF2017 family protein [Actinomycetales bacterium]|nr:DUF2017 family protein [Actinomycetales bacterium]